MTIYKHARWNPVRATGLDVPLRAKLFVVHVAVSNSANLYGKGLGPNGTIAHLYVNGSGTTYQYVDTRFRSYATGRDGNPRVISQETAGMGTHPMNDAQLEATALNFACAVLFDGVPNRIATPKNVTGLGWHRLGTRGNFGRYNPKDRRTWTRKVTGLNFGEAFGKLCPGNDIIDQIPEIYSRAQKYIRQTHKTTSTSTTALRPVKEHPFMALSDSEQKELLDAVRAINANSKRSNTILESMWKRMAGWGDANFTRLASRVKVVQDILTNWSGSKYPTLEETVTSVIAEEANDMEGASDE